MKLEFILLIVDDLPSIVEQSIQNLKEHLKDQGFILQPRYINNISSDHFRDLARSAGRAYDLVMIDYNLGNPDIDGVSVADRLRTALPYTDIVFYSSDPSTNLYRELAKKEVSGVFVANRLQLGDDLIGVADKVIAKAVDLNHMRGIAMAEVAEMDVLMKETLLSFFRSDNGLPIDVGQRAISKLTKRIQQDKDLLNNGILEIVKNSRLFSSADKYYAIRSVAKRLSEKPSDALDQLNSYQEDIIENRNILAHVREECNDDGEPILHSIRADGRTVIIDDDWMVDFRKKLRKHRDALTIVCKAIDESVGVTERPRDS